MKSDNVVILITDNNYLEYTQSMIGNLRNVGRHYGDFLVLLSEDIQDGEMEKFKKRNIYTHRVSSVSYFSKLHIFSTFIRRWSRVVCLDADYLVFKDIAPVFDQIRNGELLVDFEIYKIHQYLTPRDKAVYDELCSWFDVDRFGFNCSCLAFDTRMIGDNTLDELLALKKKYQVINTHTCETGGDGPIFNFKFYEQAKQLKQVGFIHDNVEDPIALHTTRWMAPWNHHRDRYDAGLEFFDKWSD